MSAGPAGFWGWWRKRISTRTAAMYYPKDAEIYSCPKYINVLNMLPKFFQQVKYEACKETGRYDSFIGKKYGQQKLLARGPDPDVRFRCHSSHYKYVQATKENNQHVPQ